MIGTNSGVMCAINYYSQPQTVCSDSHAHLYAFLQVFAHLHYSQLLAVCSFVFEIKTVLQRLVFSRGPR